MFSPRTGAGRTRVCFGPSLGQFVLVTTAGWATQPNPKKKKKKNFFFFFFYCKEAGRGGGGGGTGSCGGGGGGVGFRVAKVRLRGKAHPTPPHRLLRHHRCFFFCFLII